MQLGVDEIFSPDFVWGSVEDNEVAFICIGFDHVKPSLGYPFFDNFFKITIADLQFNHDLLKSLSAMIEPDDQ